MTDETPFDILCDEQEQLNPAIILAEDLMRRDAAELLSTEDINRAEEILQIGAREIEIIDRHLGAFTKSAAMPSTQVPVGF